MCDESEYKEQYIMTRFGKTLSLSIEEILMKDNKNINSWVYRETSVLKISKEYYNIEK